MRLAIGATRATRAPPAHRERAARAAAARRLRTGVVTTQWLMSVDLPVNVEVGLDLRVLALRSRLTDHRRRLSVSRRRCSPRESSCGRRRATRATLRPRPSPVHAQERARRLMAVSVPPVGTGMGLQMMAAARTIRTGFVVDGVAMLRDGHPLRRQRRGGSETLEGCDAASRRSPASKPRCSSRGYPMRSDGHGDRGRRSGRLDSPETRLPSPPVSGPGPASSRPCASRSSTAGCSMPAIVKGRRVAVVSESMARRYFGDVNAVGRRFRPDVSVDGWMQVGRRATRRRPI